MLRTLSLLFLAGGCATTSRYALPMTATQAVSSNATDALIAYLSQPDASPSVCDPAAAGVHLQRYTPKLGDALVGALLDGTVPPEPFRRCASALLKGLPQPEASALLDALAPVYEKLLSSARLETDAATAARLSALHRLYLERKSGLEGDPRLSSALMQSLREVLARNGLGPVATRFGRELLSTAELESGRWEGRPVDTKQMDALAAAGNELTLSRFAQRLPSATQREEAKRRIIRIHIALSAFSEVRGDAAAVEAAVMRDGHNEISLAVHPVVRAGFAQTLPQREVVVRQRVWPQMATLLSGAPGRAAASLLPELSMRGTLWAELEGLSRPVGVCSRAKDLDVAPCIAEGEVSIDNPFAYLDKGARVHFHDEVKLPELLPVAKQASFTLPVKIGQVDAAALSWSLVFDKPEDLLFAGDSSGGIGPDVLVEVDHRFGGRYVFQATVPDRRYLAFVESPQLETFRVGSQGGRGIPGSNGLDGTAGNTGGECQNGSPGGDGSNGGDGGPGGRGGTVRAIITCGAVGCAPDMTRLQSVVVSQGGPGGSGGAGGAGGLGGSGGAGRSSTSHVDSNGTLIVDDPGCSAGSSGMNGSSGSSGANGPYGPPGRVTFEPARGVL
jgi:hypothetical protein